MKLKILVKESLADAVTSRFLEIEGEHCLVGRKDADVLLAEPHCSRNHALIYLSRAGDLQVRDLQSTNGTYLNEHRVTEAVVKVGDEIRIGGTTLLLVDCKRSSAQPPALDGTKRAKEVTVVWTKEDTKTLREAAQKWSDVEQVLERNGPAHSQTYIPGKGSRA